MHSASAHIVIWLIITLLPATALSASSPSPDGPTEASRNLSHYRGLVVDSIIIDNRDIYDTSDPEFAGRIFAWANRLHWKTSADVIRREVLVEESKPFDPRLAEETARNLRQRLSLYDAWIEVEKTAQDSIVVRVVTIDEWSLAVVINFTQLDEGNRWQLGLRERNLIGRDLQFDFTYHIDPAEGDYVSAAYADDRFYGQPLRLDISYNDNPMARVRSLTVGRPFYDLAQSLWYKLQVLTVDGRRDIYDDRRLIAQSEYNSDGAEAGVAWRTGSYSRKLTVACDYRYTFSRIDNPRVVGSQPGDSLQVQAALPEDSLYHQTEVGLEYREMEFIKLRRVDGFGYTEDFNLGLAAMVAIGRALNDEENLYNRLTLGAEHTAFFNSTLTSIATQGQIWTRQGNTRRSLLSVGARIYNRSLPYLTLALAAGYTRDYRSEGVNSLTLGGNHIRGYPDQFRTGDRRLTLNAEARVFTGLSLLTVEVGGAAFADMGRFWRHGDPKTGSFYGSGGIGLRFSSKNASRAALARIDLSYSATNGWSVEIASGQFFDALIGFTPLTSY